MGRNRQAEAGDRISSQVGRRLIAPCSRSPSLSRGTACRAHTYGARVRVWQYSPPACLVLVDPSERAALHVSFRAVARKLVVVRADTKKRDPSSLGMTLCRMTHSMHAALTTRGRPGIEQVPRRRADDRGDFDRECAV